jgi:hypothetical protein
VVAEVNRTVAAVAVGTAVLIEVTLYVAFWLTVQVMP